MAPDRVSLKLLLNTATGSSRNAPPPSKVLFGEDHADIIMRPSPVPAEEWALLDKINKEKELIGMYLTAHPLDQFKPEIANLCNCNFYRLNNELNEFKGKEIIFPGIVKSFQQGISQKNNRPIRESRSGRFL